MTSIGSPSPFFFGGKKAYEVERSLRFDDNQSSPTRLTRTVQSGGNLKKFTVSFWVKRSQLGNTSYSNSSGNSGQQIIHTVGAGNRGVIKFTSADKIQFTQGSDSGVSAGNISTNAVFRDVSAWYHIVVVADYANSTTADRAKIFVNGVRQDVTTTTNFADANGKLNTNQIHELGFAEYGSGYTGSSWWYNFFCGYMAEFYFIDGQAYDPSYFTETNVTTGQLVPKEYTGSFGTTGWYLNFSDNSGTTATTLGKDSSGNGNNWTPSNFSVAAGAGNDSLEDTPTNNFCTLNPLAMIVTGNVTPSNGNLDASFGSVSGGGGIAGTFAVSSRKWYWEIKITAVSSARIGIGVVDDAYTPSGGVAYYDPGVTSGSYGYINSGTKYNNATDSSYGASYTTNDVIGVALDLDNGTITFYKNNSSQGQAFSGLTGGFSPAIGDGSSAGTHSISANFGQRAFSYTPPTGFKALNSANLPDPTILLPNKHFDTVLYTGDGNATGSQTNVLEFQPDWLWSKPRTAAYVHLFYDSVRGAGNSKALNTGGGSPVGTGAEGAAADNATYGFLNSFDANGFSYTRGSATTTYFNQSGINYAVWNWNGGDTDGKTYTVKVHNFSGNNRYIFDDFQTEAVTLDLAEGGTYIFNMDDASNASHPFSIGTAANGTVYTSGITYFLDGVSKTYSEYTSGFAAATTRRLHITVPASAPVLYYWCSVHSGMGGQINTNSTLGSSNFDGDLQSTAKVNSTAGFSIVKWTSGANAYKTVGHGLGVKPDIVILKSVSIAAGWFVYYDVVDGTNDYLSLNTSGASLNAESYSIVPPTSSVFGTDGAFVLGATNVTMIAYVFSSVEGYSKIGSYKGNGSTDGPFVFTGFRPAWVMIKISSTTENWTIFDNKRSEFNLSQLGLYANLTSAEVNISTNGIDILSNGFKLRGTGSRTNQNNGTFIYLAFAESPFKYARAR